MAAVQLPQTGSTSVAITTLQSPFAGQGFDLWGSVTINGIKYVCPNDGYFTIKGAARKYRWDIQNGLMLQGAQEYLRGVTPPEFTLEYSFWAESQYETFIEIIAGFQYNLKNILNAQTAPDPKQVAAAAKARQAFIDAQNSPGNTDLEQQAQDAAQAARDVGKPANSPFGPNGQLIVRAVTIYHPALDLIGISQVIVLEAGAPEQSSDDHMWKASFKLQEYFPPLALPPQDKDSAPQSPGDPLAPELKDKAAQLAALQNTASSPGGWVGLKL